MRYGRNALSPNIKRQENFLFNRGIGTKISSICNQVHSKAKSSSNSLFPFCKPSFALLEAGEIRRFYLGWLENKIKFIDFNRTMTNSPWSVHKLKREAERNLNIFPPFLSPPSPGGAIRPKNHRQVIFWATLVGFSDFWCSTDAAKSWLLRF